MNRIGWTLATSMRPLLPSSGRHGTAGGTAGTKANPCGGAPASRRTPLRVGSALRGEDVRLVRPFVVAFERQREEARQHPLRLATHDIDVGLLVTLGVRVAK